MIWLLLASVHVMSILLLCLPPPSLSLSYSAPPNTHMHTLTEAVVLFDYEKQEDDELSLKVGDIITDVKQVCAASCTCMYTN